jgi:hypothetical protein
MTKLTWREYYWRVLGFALAGAGAGLVLDELIHGPFALTPANHEFWGLVMLIAGCAAITRKPHGKDFE